MKIKPRKLNSEKLPIIQFNYDVWLQIQFLVEECTTEVGWKGAVSRSENIFTIKKIWVPEQEVTATTTDITDEGESWAGFECHNDFNDLDMMRYWGHSHVNMGVSPSGTDDKQMEEYMDNGCTFYIRSIHNKKGACYLDLYDAERELEFYNLEPKILYPQEITEALLVVDSALKDNVNTRVYVAPPKNKVGLAGGNNYPAQIPHNKGKKKVTQNTTPATSTKTTSTPGKLSSGEKSLENQTGQTQAGNEEQREFTYLDIATYLGPIISDTGQRYSAYMDLLTQQTETIAAAIIITADYTPAGTDDHDLCASWFDCAKYLILKEETLGAEEMLETYNNAVLYVKTVSDLISDLNPPEKSIVKVLLKLFQIVDIESNKNFVNIDDEILTLIESISDSLCDSYLFYKLTT